MSPARNTGHDASLTWEVRATGRARWPKTTLVPRCVSSTCIVFFFQAEDGIRDYKVTGVQTCALPICSAGSYTWAGLLNCYYWIDPARQVTGAMFTQLLPFYDARVVDLYGAFERGLYGDRKSVV